MSPAHDLSSLENAELPHLLGRYLLQRLIGKGGMGLVFEAELQGPVGFRKQVALKLLKTPKGGPTDEQRQELAGEARLGGLLRHPNIVDTYELGEHEGRFFISLELIDGMSLQQILRERGALPPLAALDVACQACAGLAHAHALRVQGRSVQFVHRDLKMGNILVTRDGLVKLVDFGISHALGVVDSPDPAEGVVGTPSYMSPEQVLSEPLDARSDLFSLGVILYSLLTGNRLFPGKTAVEVLQNVLNVDGFLQLTEPLVAVEAVLPGSAAVLSRCLAADRRRRHGSAAELAVELDALRSGAGAGPGLGGLLNSLLEGDASHGTPWRQPVVGDSAGRQETPSTTVTQLPPSGLPAPRTNLAGEPDRFVGREDDLEALAGCFEKGVRLVTLKGLGGVGKTRLAQRFGALYLEECPGGVWWVDLAEVRSATGVLHATSRALDVPLGGAALEDLVTQLGHAIAARGPVLLVLDNFEQVVEDAPATVGRWLEMAPEARFLATSRESLKLSGEEVLSLLPLLKKDGITLFELRARAAGAGWKDNDENAAAVARIVHELDGLPLAIELAAARARLLSPAQLLERLSERFELLRGGRRGASPRQATLEGLIDWSWNLLQAWEQAALAQLSVFRGGFFMEAAEEVIDLAAWPEAPWSLDVVGSLLDKSLLYSREVLDQPRFGMYRSIQEYAAEKLNSAAPPMGGERAVRESRLRHASHYARLGDAESIEARDTGGGTDSWLPLFLELENLVVTVESGLATGHLEEAAAAAKGAVAILMMQGPYTTALALLERVLAEPELGDRTRLRLEVSHGWLLGITGQAEQALSVLTGGLARARALGELQLEGRLRNNLGRLCQRQSRMEEGYQHYLRSQSIASELGDRPGEIKSLVLSADLYRERGEVDEALANYHRALVIIREVGNRRLEGQIFTSLGGLYLEMGRLEESGTHFEKSLSLARRGGNRRSEGFVLGLLGQLYTELGHQPEALSYYEQCLEIVRQLGDRSHQGVTLGNIGDLLIQHGDWQGAENRLTESIGLLDEVYPAAAGAFRGSLALVRARQGDFDTARVLLARGEEQLRGVYAFEFAKLLCRRGTVEAMAGDSEAALGALAEAQSIAVEIKSGPESELGHEIAQLRQQLHGSPQGA